MRGRAGQPVCFAAACVSVCVRTACVRACMIANFEGVRLGGKGLVIMTLIAKLAGAQLVRGFEWYWSGILQRARPCIQISTQQRRFPLVHAPQGAVQSKVASLAALVEWLCA